MADKLLGGVIINEVLPDPNSASGGTGAHYDTDGNGTVAAVDEFVEIMNTSAVAINIGGVQLWDQSIGRYFTFPSGTILQPGAHAMVMTGAAGGPGPVLGVNDLAFYAGRGSAVLNNGPENTILYDPGTHEYVQISYGGAGIVTPTGATGSFPGFPAGSSQVGSGEVFGGFVPGYSIQRSPDGSGSFVNNQTPTPSSANVCFVAGNLIATPKGLRPVEALQVGDLVCTATGDTQPILWIGRRHIAAAELAGNPKLWPVRILPGALGAGLPRRSLRLSRQHRLALSGLQAKGDVLVPALSLLDLPGVDSVMPLDGVSYIHLLLPCHAVLNAEGAAVESLYLGREAGKALGQAALAEIAAILGKVPDFARPAAAALPLMKAGEARRALRSRAACQPLAACAPPREGRKLPSRGCNVLAMA